MKNKTAKKINRLNLNPFRMLRQSVLYKLVFSIIITIVVFGSIAALIVGNQVNEELLTIKKGEIEELTQSEARRIELLFKTTQNIVDSLQKAKLVRDYIEKGNYDNNLTIFDELSRHNIDNTFSLVYLLDPLGTAIASTEERLMGENYSFRDYYKSALQKKRCVDTAIGVTTLELGYYFSSGIYQEGTLIGVAVAKLAPKEVNKIIQATSNEKEDDFTKVEYFLVNSDGIILYAEEKDDLYKSLGNLSTKTKRELKENREFEGIEILSLGYQELQDRLGDVAKTESFTTKNALEESKLVVITKINGCKFYIVSITDPSSLGSAAKVISKTVLSTVLIVASVALVLVLYWVDIILKPLKKLKNSIEKAVVGEEYHKVEVTSKDEIGELANIFNKMSEKLHLERKNVKQKIETQTQKLEQQQAALLNVLEDVQEEKKLSETVAQDLQKYQLAVESASDQIIITDTKGIILFANKATAKITGYDREEIIGKKAGSKELWGGLMEDEFYKKFWNTVSIKKQSFNGIFKNKKKNGEQYSAMAKISPILNRKGDVIFFVGIERDITRELEVDRMKTEFISLASHQLRTPLSAIKWFLEMLLTGDAGKLSSEQEEYLQNIDSSNERMIELVNALLNVSRIESGKIIVDPKPTDLVKLLKTLLIELESSIKTKKIVLHFKHTKKIPLINIDAKLIRSVYQNLLTNAIKYTPAEGTINVNLTLDDNKILSEITDTGYGIPNDAKEKIFTKFFRADNIVGIETDGNGLGLYLAKAVIETSGGNIWFDSQEKVGTTFWFDLPLEGSKAHKGVVSIDS